MDAFYVITAEGSKLLDPDRIAAVRTGLLEVLESGDSEPHAGRRARARASPAR